MLFKTRPFDPADYLDTAEGIEEYLSAAFESDDSQFVADAIRVIARAHEMWTKKVDND